MTPCPWAAACLPRTTSPPQIGAVLYSCAQLYQHNNGAAGANGAVSTSLPLLITTTHLALNTSHRLPLTCPLFTLSPFHQLSNDIKTQNK